MNFQHYMVAPSLEGSKQVIPQGPVAALEFIKNLGTNGGGFFNTNGAHPYENPTPLTNLMEMLAVVLLPAALTNTFGRMIRQPRQGWLLYAVMVTVLRSKTQSTFARTVSATVSVKRSWLRQRGVALQASVASTG
jgi:K+-transporting ATPase ATPase A chain